MTALVVNGRSVEVDDDPRTPLLYVLRDTLELNGAKFGCGLGQCGACTVLVDGEPAFSCLTPIAAIRDRRITTVEGLGDRQHPGIVQQAFVVEQAAQCGYCIAGMIMRTQALIERGGSPTDDEIRAALEPNLCRCGTHFRIFRAVRRALRMRQAAAASAGASALGSAG